MCLKWMNSQLAAFSPAMAMSIDADLYPSVSWKLTGLMLSEVTDRKQTKWNPFFKMPVRIYCGDRH